MKIPLTTQEKAACITQLVCAAINLDHAARRLQDHKAFRHDAKFRLTTLTAASDAFVEAACRQFDFRDGDAVNALSDVLGQHAELLLQCTPAQVEQALQHLNRLVNGQEGGKQQ